MVDKIIITQEYSITGEKRVMCLIGRYISELSYTQHSSDSKKWEVHITLFSGSTYKLLLNGSEAKKLIELIDKKDKGTIIIDASKGIVKYEE